ncbi:RES family NAD+ phosphorylase [Curtobacterium flaccumfaciens]|uniref:RES family NAD+ phosphorylase n=1 Tax=Curtobacterium flaccumfaciens TaxID=2035 RepID=UPI00265A68BF|nr:RES family NAD+ phosphorylase [Curtobacterium flaccumfaciens]MCS5520755.1 RES family NAD+ phosphorylase [Curtobacterium flaccumfaciens]
MFRAHLAAFGPWFFASHPRGRFNLEDPNGTCYFADDIETAVREFYGPKIRRNELSAKDAEVLRVSRVLPPEDATYAHVSGSGAARFGVTSELATMGDYEVTRAWAEVFNERVNGLRYNSRFNPGSESWALFGIAGAAPSLGVDPSGSVDGAAAVKAAGVTVLPEPPMKRSVRMVPPPSAAPVD